MSRVKRLVLYSYRLETSDLESRGAVLCSKNKDADQMHGTWNKSLDKQFSALYRHLT